jgi:F0F1-type ATP synthase membrane subunit c/vacuolar-type H+-ATPase subunit K
MAVAFFETIGAGVAAARAIESARQQVARRPEVDQKMTGVESDGMKEVSV